MKFERKAKPATTEIALSNNGKGYYAGGETISGYVKTPQGATDLTVTLSCIEESDKTKIDHYNDVKTFTCEGTQTPFTIRVPDEIKTSSITFGNYGVFWTVSADVGAEHGELDINVVPKPFPLPDEEQFVLCGNRTIEALLPGHKTGLLKHLDAKHHANVLVEAHLKLPQYGFPQLRPITDMKLHVKPAMGGVVGLHAFKLWVFDKVEKFSKYTGLDAPTHYSEVVDTVFKQPIKLEEGINDLSYLLEGAEIKTLLPPSFRSDIFEADYYVEAVLQLVSAEDPNSDEAAHLPLHGFVNVLPPGM